MSEAKHTVSLDEIVSQDFAQAWLRFAGQPMKSFTEGSEFKVRRLGKALIEHGKMFQESREKALDETVLLDEKGERTIKNNQFIFKPGEQKTFETIMKDLAKQEVEIPLKLAYAQVKAAFTCPLDLSILESVIDGIPD